MGKSSTIASQMKNVLRQVRNGGHLNKLNIFVPLVVKNVITQKKHTNLV